MPRPEPPPLLSTPVVSLVKLDSIDQRSIARTLGLTALSPEIDTAICDAIACYRATRGVGGDTTKGNTLAALEQLTKQGKDFKKDLARFASDLCGADYTTHGRLQALAQAALDGDDRARARLVEAAKLRMGELRGHPRVAPATEAFRYFCGWLRIIFDGAASETMSRTWRECGRFAIQVFSAAEIDHDFDAHPERLREYLATDIGLG